MMSAAIEWVDCCASTNSLMKQRADGLPHAAVIAAREQTAGRGQRGNSWEAEPGRNLTFSMLLRPAGMPAVRQFEISMLAALAVATVVERHLGPQAQVDVKWPNDIYVADRKLAGTLIECSLQGSSIGYLVLGVGLNVNQTRFLSDAPNPVSLAMIAGHDFELEPLMQEIAQEIAGQMAIYEDDPDFDALHHYYMERLWRRRGIHPWRDAATGEVFDASIADVLPTGLLRLRKPDGTLHDYEFKQISAVL